MDRWINEYVDLSDVINLGGMNRKYNVKTKKALRNDQLSLSFYIYITKIEWGQKSEWLAQD